MTGVAWSGVSPGGRAKGHGTGAKFLPPSKKGNSVRRQRFGYQSTRRFWPGLVLASVSLAMLHIQPVVALEMNNSLGPPQDVIVVLKPTGRTPVARITGTLEERHGLSLGPRYSHVFEGFAASVPSSEVAALRSDPAVAAVYSDGVARVSGQRPPTGVRRVQADSYNRVRAETVVVDGDIAILDTGVSKHADLNRHRTINCSSDAGCSRRGPARDVYGHGTSVAGVAAALDDNVGVVGTAPGARIWNIKVFDNYGSAEYSWIIAALDWVTARAARIEVANLSLSGNNSEAVKLAITGATDAGVVVVAAAGNASASASDQSPANAPDAITVSAFVDTDGEAGGLGRRCRIEGDAIQRDDRFWRYSNYGPVVDIAAPGACIRSAAAGGGYVTYSGTSFAAPHVAGAALVWINRANLPATPDRATLVTKQLRGPWGKPQEGLCGFRGGKSPEPVLIMGRCQREIRR